MERGFETSIVHMFGYGIEQDYFQWLCDIVHIEQEYVSYRLLARDLHRRPFLYFVDYDENRAGDGLELREEYMRQIDYPGYADIEGECSVFEMIVALARRMDFETSDPYDLDDLSDRTAFWFWEIMDNLGLSRYSDDVYVEESGDVMVDFIIDLLLERKYEPNGIGGMFPLESYAEDQRYVEIWNQMNAYLSEREGIR